MLMTGRAKMYETVENSRDYPCVNRVDRIMHHRNAESAVAECRLRLRAVPGGRRPPSPPDAGHRTQPLTRRCSWYVLGLSMEPRGAAWAHRR